MTRPCMASPHKKKYGTEQAARAMIRFRGTDAPHLRAYRCKSCHSWHLSSAKKK